MVSKTKLATVTPHSVRDSERANEKWEQRHGGYMKNWTLAKADGLTAEEAGEL